ncbi:MAG TPA: preprotein translocase subunit YajC [Tepidisphaeraceae bacterium]|nr:preprotein translocase subunit YajC [Tepidisphaeraceae bacterium]
MSTFQFLAQVTTHATSQPIGNVDPPIWANPWFPAVLGIAVFYFILIRPKKNQDKARTSMLSTLKRGDRVQTIGGVLGTVVEAREDEVVVKVDESNNTKMKFTRSAIHKVIPDGEKPASDEK